MPKFFIEKENISGNYIYIYGDDVNHIRRVLRLKCGDNIIVCDGNGYDYDVRIECFEQEAVKTSIVSTSANISEPPVDVTLFQGIPKSDKMDFIIQKSVELGVNRIIPVSTERTVVRIDSKKDAESKVSRWQRIALEAAKQCNRGAIPQISFPISYLESLDLAKQADLAIIPYEKETGNGLRVLIKEKNIKKLSILIGPEGGFSEKEIENAIRYGINPVTLGPRILRTETAGIAVISILMYELGDIGK
ncbi:MAG: 16S rRNA (uracil(1498)-N(3))-methyltransferase [Clostridia bacterium]|nr:16S rRNA (uracil(1498)-N(3))-methyltransferase [Clostridia bacterium]